MDVDHESQVSTEIAILLEEAHCELSATHRRHNRTLVWIIVLILVVGSMLVLALMKIANRPMIFVMPTREITPAAPENPVQRAPLVAPRKQKNSSSPAGRANVSGLVAPALERASCAAAANCSNPLRRLDPAQLNPGKTPVVAAVVRHDGRV